MSVVLRANGRVIIDGEESPWVDPFAPDGAIRTLGPDDYALGDRRLCEWAAAKAGVDIDAQYVVGSHVAEGAVWVDVLVPTGRRDAPAIPTLYGPGPHDISLVFRRFKG